jgi:nickel transport protein
MAKYVLTLLFFAPAPAFAHSLYLFAQVRGATIVGRAYFPGDIGAQQTDVIARDSSGRELDRTKTDDQGNFTLPAQVRTDYHLTAITADGHTASYVVSAAELPGNLPTDSTAPAKQRQPSTAESPPTNAAAGSQDQPTSVASQPAKQRQPSTAETAPGDAVAGPQDEPTSVAAQLESLQRQIEAMRVQIDQSEHRLRLHDLLGGIGYILGLAGLGFYLKTRPRNPTPTTRNQP